MRSLLHPASLGVMAAGLIAGMSAATCHADAALRTASVDDMVVGH